MPQNPTKQPSIIFQVMSIACVRVLCVGITCHLREREREREREKRVFKEAVIF